MGKKQHQKDKLYLTTTEWQTEWGGKKANRVDFKDLKTFKRLPFDHCSLSLQPFKNAYSDKHGNIFDLAHILPFIKKYKVNPVNGEPLSSKDLIKLNLVRNSEGEIHCPILFKVFNDNSHVVCIAKTGNVYSYEAVDEMNMKARNWKDLLSDEPFSRNEIITLQNPLDTTFAERNRNLSSFHHIKKKLSIVSDELVRASYDANARLKNISSEAKSTLTAIQSLASGNQKSCDDKPLSDVAKSEIYGVQSSSNVEGGDVQQAAVADAINAAPYSMGKVAASFTSTAFERKTKHQSAILHSDVVRYSRVKEKGYVRLITTVGNINIEIHCDYIPKLCENFIKLCESGYYNKTIFHRSIKHFMIQGGDPLGSGKGGESFWGGSLPDQFVQHLSHSSRGVLSMANSGPDSNKSQFFITYRPCPHLDKKHSIIGRVVGGVDTTLAAMESIETDNKDRPVQDIVLEKIIVFVDPFSKVDEQIAKERLELNKTGDKDKTLNKTDQKRSDDTHSENGGVAKKQKFEPNCPIGQFLVKKKKQSSRNVDQQLKEIKNVKNDSTVVVVANKNRQMTFDSW